MTDFYCLSKALQMIRIAHEGIRSRLDSTSIFFLFLVNFASLLNFVRIGLTPPQITYGAQALLLVSSLL